MKLHDINVQWVQCDVCDNWYHTMWEGLTPIEEVMDGNYDVLIVQVGSIVQMSSSRR